MERLVWVSNRLAMRMTERDGVLQAVPSTGGLASALRDLHARMAAHWIGWPGDVSEAQLDEARRVLTENGATPLFLSADEVKGYYEGFSNGVLWPILHGNIDKLPLHLEQSWRTFVAVSRRFADVCIARARGGEVLWLHDFHLSLVPSLVREEVLGAVIGFFLHVPFPPAEVFTTLPRWREIVSGLLGADIIGFHTRGFLECFKDVAARLGARVRGSVVEFAGHKSELGVFPIGVDFEKLDAAAREPGALARAAAVRAEAGDRTLLLGVDRLDYTKGLPRRLLAIERLLEDAPELAGKLRFIQLAVPTRTNVEAYVEFRSVVNGLVGRINSRFATPTGVPIHFMHREVSLEELVALYRAADVMVVTPLRDGMNLVCKEFVAARGDERGALVLSEFAGAADELTGALQVNPFDVDDVARKLREAIAMPHEEQRARMTAMRRVVATQDVRRWADSFVEALERAKARASDDAFTDELTRAAHARHLHVVLDYDGTLVPIAATPSQAGPDEELLTLLRDLAALPDTSVHIVSGRATDTLDAWLGGLPIALYAEHGAHEKKRGAPSWTIARPPGWIDDAATILDELARTIPGTLVERKRSGVAFHTRSLPAADRRDVEERVRVLLEGKLGSAAAILLGDCVVEARDPHVHKGRVVGRLELDDGDIVVAIGDDTTDDDLFAALPIDSIVVGVGPRPSRVRHRVATHLEVRVLLRRLAGARSAASREC